MQRHVFLGSAIGLALVVGIVAWLNFQTSEASPITTNQLSTFTRTGTISSIEGSQITVNTDQGELKLNLPTETLITDQNNNPIDAVELAVNDNITITYLAAGNTFTANQIEKNGLGNNQATIAPGDFNLTVVPLCNGGQPENLLTWTAAENVFDYTVAVNGQALTKTTNQTYNHRTNLEAGSTLKYQIIANNNQGQSRTKEIELIVSSCQ